VEGSLTWKIVDILFGLARLAVPVFFAISGWYIFSKNKKEQARKLKKQVIKLVKILIVIVVASSLALWVLQKMRLSALDPLPQMVGIYESFFLGKTPTAIVAFWFIVSLIIVEAIYLLATKCCRKDSWLAAAAFASFVLNLLFTTYRPFSGLPELPFSIGETWFLAFVWFSLGYLLAKYFRDKGTKSAINNKTLVRFAAIAMAFYLYEYILHTSGAPLVFGPYNYNVMFMFTPFATTGILLLAAHSRNQSKLIRSLAYLGKNYALGVFVIHVIVMQPLSKVFTKLSLLSGHSTIKLVVTYTLVVVISFALTALYYAVKSRVTAMLGRSKPPLNKA
jgi:surface polysaccharide O-acyltransferase-like enzyme